MECKLLNEYNGIAVGDTVKIIDATQAYGFTAIDWLNYYGLSKDKFARPVEARDLVLTLPKGKVLAIGKHLNDKSDLEDDMLFYVNFGEKNLVVSVDGLKLVSKTTSKNYYIVINEVKHFYIIE